EQHDELVAAQPGSEAGFVLASDRPVVIDDLAAEQRFDAAPVLRRQGARSGMSVAFRGSSRAYGVLGAHTVASRRFGEDDAAFLQSVAHVLGSAWERLESERATRHAALHDTLTDLPNRALLHDRLAQALTRARRSGGRVALLLADLDNFKLVNDSLGHEAGDQLLMALSRRLAEAVRASDTVARLGGDEFVVLLDGVGSDADVDRLTRRVVESWQAPLPTGQGDVWVSASVGVTVCEGGTRDAATLLREGDAAMYRAKAAGRGRTAHFDDGMREEGLRALRLQSDLRAALDRGQLRLAFQPIVCAEGGAPAGVEALLRWTSPRDGDVSPAEFVALAEQAGFIDRLGAFALDESCARLAAWRARFGLPAERLYVSVNVSALQLADPAFVDQVAQALARHRLPPAALALELTETALLQEGAEPRATIAALHDMGVRLVLDDFGTGYSSLSYLTRVPVSQLKIDRSFVSGPHAGSSEPIFAAVSSMAAALGLSVVAEGVETHEQLERVTAQGCNLAQGYLFSRPVPALELPEALGLVAVGA
ncbi:MAG TPA: EAL domain-containing protein, partial [Baekduia sp.]|nr:EAL domain-containing protein [Baekduia sp.]